MYAENSSHSFNNAHHPFLLLQRAPVDGQIQRRMRHDLQNKRPLAECLRALHSIISIDLLQYFSGIMGGEKYPSNITKFYIDNNGYIPPSLKNCHIFKN